MPSLLQRLIIDYSSLFRYVILVIRGYRVERTFQSRESDGYKETTLFFNHDQVHPELETIRRNKRKKERMSERRERDARLY